MKTTLIVGLAVVALTVGLLVLHQQQASAKPVEASASFTRAAPAGQLPIYQPGAEALAKKCSFNSDCSHGKCSGGVCGGCSFNSDCTSFGSCSGGRCTKSPY